MKYLVWNFEHGAWWRPGRHGYTDNIEDAGRYSAREAGEIATDSIMLESVAICEPIALRQGPPGFHVYSGEIR